ncbi:MAG: tRNA uridine-5-carboxymethylaminomethyl(34) synthesis GTPase MnmE [Eubacteriales bacterium]|nr:tRNA uridine-5-carboxymethylaminomethyl(34) synthesis GTPase MnmE [Eubacteriales bacterium]
MEDTIAAISTAYGEGGIGIIRISGENSLNILNRIFKPVSKKIESRKMIYGNIVEPSSNKIIDEVLCVYMKGPKTYTAEDVVEINCHGSIVSLKKTLEIVLQNGARLAEPGEFTKRAFLNGRLDLSQAEAVIDLIKAKSEKTFDVALNQLEGKFSEQIKLLRKKIVDTLVNIAVNIDYPDEDIEQLTYSNLSESLKEVYLEINKMIDSAETGRMIKEGLNVAIIGKPNVGKSSLMNSLLKENRAIVTEIPGTTRDTIEEMLTIRGIPVRLTDTAGIRETEDIIEKIGIEKSKESFNNADLIILMVDCSTSLNSEDLKIIEHVDNRNVILVFNKLDLDCKINKEEVTSLIPNATIVEASIATDMGIDKIENSIEELVYGGKVTQKDSLLVTNVRHKNLLVEANRSINDALEMTKNEEALEFIEIDVNSAYELLGEIIGETVQEDIINEVFARFCLGK